MGEMVVQVATHETDPITHIYKPRVSFQSRVFTLPHAQYVFATPYNRVKSATLHVRGW